MPPLSAIIGGAPGSDGPRAPFAPLESSPAEIPLACTIAATTKSNTKTKNAARKRGKGVRKSKKA